MIYFVRQSVGIASKDKLYILKEFVILYCFIHIILFEHLYSMTTICFTTIQFLTELALHIIIFQVQLYDPRTNGFAPSSPEIGMHVEVRDPDDKIMLSKVSKGLNLLKHFVCITLTWSC